MALYLHLQIWVQGLQGYKLTVLTCFTNNPIIKLYAGNIFNSFNHLHIPGVFLIKRHTTFNNNNNNNNNNTRTSEFTNVKIQKLSHVRKTLHVVQIVNAEYLQHYIP